jgi:hypothetical protein
MNPAAAPLCVVVCTQPHKKKTLRARAHSRAQDKKNTSFSSTVPQLSIICWQPPYGLNVCFRIPKINTLITHRARSRVFFPAQAVKDEICLPTFFHQLIDKRDVDNTYKSKLKPWGGAFYRCAGGRVGVGAAQHFLPIFFSARRVAGRRATRMVYRRLFPFQYVAHEAVSVRPKGARRRCLCCVVPCLPAPPLLPPAGKR